MAALSRLTTTRTTELRHLLRAAPPLLGLLTTRSYLSAAAAAQPQLDYDHYYHNYYDSDSGAGDRRTAVAAPAVVDTEGSSPRRGVHWVFIGNPNAKRHFYAEMISKLLEVPHISITSLLRQDLSPHSPIYKQIAEAVNRGKLVPESIIFGLLSKRLEDGHHRGETGFILDGIPRTRLQAEILDELVDIDLVVNFKSPEHCFQADRSPSDSRISSYGTGSSCSSCESATKDVQKVSRLYKEQQLKSLEDYYQKRTKLIDFEVGNAPGENWKGLIAALHLQHVNAVHSSRTLTMGFRVP